MKTTAYCRFQSGTTTAYGIVEGDKVRQLDGDLFAAAVLLGLFGALIGFLRYNSYPAILFMGDTGSLLLGYTLGAMAVLMVQPDATPFRLTPVTVGAIRSATSQSPSEWMVWVWKSPRYHPGPRTGRSSRGRAESP